VEALRKKKGKRGGGDMRTIFLAALLLVPFSIGTTGYPLEYEGGVEIHRLDGHSYEIDLYTAEPEGGSSHSLMPAPEDAVCLQFDLDGTESSAAIEAGSPAPSTQLDGNMTFSVYHPFPTPDEGTTQLITTQISISAGDLYLSDVLELTDIAITGFPEVEESFGTMTDDLIDGSLDGRDTISVDRLYGLFQCHLVLFDIFEEDIEIPFCIEPFTAEFDPDSLNLYAEVGFTIEDDLLPIDLPVYIVLQADGALDSDCDEWPDDEDNCPGVYNPTQEDMDEDGWGEACDCEDTESGVNPGSDEVCDNGIDDDCDGLMDLEDHPDCKSVLEVEASYEEETHRLSLNYTIRTPVPATWGNYLVLTYPSVQVLPLWTASLPVIDPPYSLPTISFYLPPWGLVGTYTCLFTVEGPQAVTSVWVDTGWSS